jgi:hypothetical protein
MRDRSISMKRWFFCALAVFGSVGSTEAMSSPYTVDGSHVSKVDQWYQTTHKLDNGPHNVMAIEFSIDGYIYGVNPYADTLERIDPESGIAEIVGPLGVDLDPGDLDEDAQGQLWMLEYGPARLYTIDRTSGTATLHCEPDDETILGLVSIGDQMYTTSSAQVPSANPGCGLEYLYRGGYSLHLEHGPGGYVYILGFYHVGWHYTVYTFTRYDPETGQSSRLGEIGRPDGSGALWSLTFDPADLQPHPPPVPALDSSGIAILIAFVAAAALSRLRP